jgi:hypothetical protein
MPAGDAPIGLTSKNIVCPSLQRKQRANQNQNVDSWFHDEKSMLLFPAKRPCAALRAYCSTQTLSPTAPTVRHLIRLTSNVPSSLLMLMTSNTFVSCTSKKIRGALQITGLRLPTDVDESSELEQDRAVSREKKISHLARRTLPRDCSVAAEERRLARGEFR